MRKLFSNRYVKPFLAWITLSAYMLLAFITLIAIETATRKYPDRHWWMASIPVNVFSDAFIPVVKSAISIFFIPFGIIIFLPILSFTFRWNRVQKAIEVICYILSVGYLWFGFWLTGFQANCQMLSLQSDGGGWGPCGYWAWYSRPLSTFIWHTILWIIWSVVLISMWSNVKRKLISEGDNIPLAGVQI